MVRLLPSSPWGKVQMRLALVQCPQGWTSAAFLLFYMLVFGASWGPVPWAMPSEIFPSSLRAKSLAISTCSSKLLSRIYLSIYVNF